MSFFDCGTSCSTIEIIFQIFGTILFAILLIVIAWLAYLMFKSWGKYEDNVEMIKEVENVQENKKGNE